MFKSAAILAILVCFACAGELSQSDFTLWGTCSTDPYLIQGTNGICVLVGTNDSGCGLDDVAAVQKGGQSAKGLSFTGAFKGGSNAPDGSNEMAVFIADDITTWVGHEMGFVKTLSDNCLKGYLQGAGQYLYQTVDCGDDGYHNFEALAQSDDHSQVDYYVDGEYKFTLQNPGQSYYGNWYYFVGTTHKTTDNWNSAGEQVEMYSMTTL